MKRIRINKQQENHYKYNKLMLKKRRRKMESCGNRSYKLLDLSINNMIK
jgi:hypothetical protein